MLEIPDSKGHGHCIEPAVGELKGFAVTCQEGDPVIQMRSCDLRTPDVEHPRRDIDPGDRCAGKASRHDDGHVRGACCDIEDHRCGGVTQLTDRATAPVPVYPPRKKVIEEVIPECDLIEHPGDLLFFSQL